MSAEAPVNLEPTIGAYFIAAITSVGLLGVATLQCFRYFLTFPRDPPLLKITVASVWTLEFIKSTLAIHGSYNVTVKHWGERAILVDPGWSLKAILIFTPFIIFIVHLFFVHKVWMLLRKSLIIPSILALLSLGGFALGIAAYVEAVFAKVYEDSRFSMTDRLTMAALGCALVVDWSVTISLVTLLREQHSSFSRTNRLIRKLIFYTINIGLLTSISDLVVLVLLNVDFRPFDALYSISIYEIVGNLYSNSLLACLNSRVMVSSELNRPHDVEHSTIAFEPNPASTTRFGGSTTRTATSKQSQVVYLYNTQTSSRGGDPGESGVKYPPTEADIDNPVKLDNVPR